MVLGECSTELPFACASDLHCQKLKEITQLLKPGLIDQKHQCWQGPTDMHVRCTRHDACIRLDGLVEGLADRKRVNRRWSG